MMETIPLCSSGRRGTAALPNSGKKKEKKKKKLGVASLPKGGGGVTQENWRGASDSLGQEGKVSEALCSLFTLTVTHSTGTATAYSNHKPFIYMKKLRATGAVSQRCLES
jgi:hypothetical protein